MREEKETSLSGKLYVEKDREGNRKQVQTTDFDNTESGLNATTIKDAIDELKALIDAIGP